MSGHAVTGARRRRGFGLVLAVTATLACAGVRSAGQGAAVGPVSIGADAAVGWQSLALGDAARARGRLEQGRRLRDPAARFGLVALAFERGDEALALDESLTLLAELGRTAPLAARSTATGETSAAMTALIADATAARLRELVDTVVEPRAYERRLVELPLAGLPWRARLAVEDAVDQVGRRRAAADLLAARPATAGCLTDVSLVAQVGRLPHVDLAAAVPASAPPAVRLRSSGCRLWLPSRDGWSGVRVLHAVVPPARGPRVLVLDFDGPALVAIGTGASATRHRHDSDTRFGPRARAIDLPETGAAIPIEVRLGTFGGSAELRLFALPAVRAPAIDGPGLPPATAALADLATLLGAGGVGDVDAALAAVARLEEQPQFAVGLAAAAAFVVAEPSRPTAQTRAEADRLLRRAAAATPGLARVLRALAIAELGHNRGSEAAAFAEEAVKANPGFWPAALTLSEAQRSRGLERQADETLDRALAAVGTRDGACPLVQLALDRARGRHRLADEAALVARLARCDARLVPEVEWHLGRGDARAARAALLRREATAVDPSAFATQAAELDLAVGDAAAAARRLRAALRDRVRDPALRLRYADALAAAGDGARAEAVLAATVRHFPADSGVVKLAHLRGLALPIEGYRRDGRAIIAAFRAAGRNYDAPAVLVLDRTVLRVLPDGTTVVLTHNIVNVKTKDGITRWGEVAVPPGAEILTLRTHKPDGSTREPEEIGGKDTISAPDLAPGDFIEWETLENRAPSDGLAPGFLAERFYFQSVELPLDLSELVVVAPPGLPLDFDRRAGAPAPVESRAADGARVVRFAATHMPQLFAERAAVRHEDWIPSVRASSGLTPGGFVRTLRDNLHGVARGSPALRARAELILAEAPPEPRAQAAAIVHWVMANVEAETGAFESATATLARGRGNRAGLIVALARAAGLDVSLALARPLGTAPADAPLVAQELDDFSELLVRFRDPAGTVDYLDPRYEHAAFGYLPPGLDGAVALVVGQGRLERLRSRDGGGDHRQVALDLVVDETGQARGTVIETLRGWPAIEWAAFAKQWGDDSRKLRQEFEQRWLGQHFPGARLGGLAIDVDRARPGHARLRYSLVGLDLATGAGEDGEDEEQTAGAGAGTPAAVVQHNARGGRSARIAPAFFRASPGRRFATVPARRTPLLLGPEVELALVARLSLPPGAEVREVGRGGAVVDAAAEGLRFHEERRVLPAQSADLGPAIELRRTSRLPLLRVSPAAYRELAPKLRRIDALERAEIHFSLRAGPAAERRSP